MKKEKGSVLPVFLLLLVLAFIGGVSYYKFMVYDKKDNKPKENNTVVDNGNTNNKEENNNTNEEVNEEPDENTIAVKINENRDWVYDAEYEKNVTVDSYSTKFKKTYYAKDIIVPYLNINSSYANTSNNKIKEVFDQAISDYNEGVTDKLTHIDECGYKKYTDNDILSIILTYAKGFTSIVHPKYYTYNISLTTGKQLSYKEIYSFAGFNSSNIDSKVENAITKMMKEEMSQFSPENYPEGTNFDTYNNESIDNYKKSVSNNTLRYYISEDKKLNVVVTLSIPADTGEFDTIITVD